MKSSQKLLSREIKVDDLSLSYLEAGSGQELVFLPGLGQNCNQWKEVIKILAKSYHIYSLSLPTYSDPREGGGCYSFDTYPDLLQQIFIKLSINNPILIGHSLGALVSVRYAEIYGKKVNKLIVVSSPWPLNSKSFPVSWKLGINYFLKAKNADKFFKFLSRRKSLIKVIGQVALPNVLQGDIKHICDYLSKIPTRSYAACYYDLISANASESLKKIKVPTLFIYGEKDSATKRVKSMSTYQFLEGAKVIAVPCGHYIPSEYPPKDLAQIIDKFVNEN